MDMQVTRRRAALLALSIGGMLAATPHGAQAQATGGSASPTAPAASQDASKAPRDIPVGAPLRKVLLDSLRPSIAADVGQPVQFVVRKLSVQGRWAFVDATPEKKGGGAIDFTKTRYAQMIADGVWDGPYLYALLEDRGGRWTVRSFVIGPTDVAYAAWPEELGAPRALFGPLP